MCSVAANPFQKTIFSLHFHHYPEGYNERQCHIMAAVIFISTLKSELPVSLGRGRKAAMRTLPRSQTRKAKDQKESRGPRSNFEFS